MLIRSSYALDLQQSIIVGHSAGGHLAFWAAARHRLPAESPLVASKFAHQLPLAVISLAGAIDLEHTWQLQSGGGATATFVGGSPAEYPERYASASPACLLPLGVPQNCGNLTRSQVDEYIQPPTARDTHAVQIHLLALLVQKNAIFWPYKEL
jgi:acetyl esterase/lipase